MSISCELTDFFSDSKLVELIEITKSSSDVLDLLKPRENQHSDVLAWCFNSKEGHGQGDAILKDFLTAVYISSTDKIPGDRISGRGLGKDFIRKWNPARIMTASFATAICYREYTFARNITECDKSNQRVDLLIIDPDNEFIIVIENKTGSRFGKGQLDGYLNSAKSELTSRPVFKKGFDILFVALDLNFDPESEAIEDQNFDPRWVRLNYEWLKPASKRAELAIARGNKSGEIVLSYGRRQTGWESSEMRQTTRLARDLAIRFPQIVEKLSTLVKQYSKPQNWTPQLLDKNSSEGQLLKLYLQNNRAITKLINLSPLQLLHGRLSEHFPDIESEVGSYEYGRVWINYQLPFDGSMPKTEYRWPLYLNIRHVNPEDSKSHPKFRMRLIWRPYYIPDSERSKVCKYLSQYYPKSSDSADRQKGLYLINETSSNYDHAESVATDIFYKLTELKNIKF